MFESHRNPNSRTLILHKQRSTLTFRFVVSIVLSRFHFGWTMDVVLRWAIWKLNKWEHASDSPFFLLLLFIRRTHADRERNEWKWPFINSTIWRHTVYRFAPTRSCLRSALRSQTHTRSFLTSLAPSHTLFGTCFPFSRCPHRMWCQRNAVHTWVNVSLWLKYVPGPFYLFTAIGFLLFSRVETN